MKNQLEKPFVLITGCSTGIGRATALYLDKLGYRVFAGVRKRSDLEQLAEVTSQNFYPLLLDVTDSHSIAEVFKIVEQEVGSQGLAGLINNAGIAIGGVQEFLDLDDLRRQFEVNVVGVAAITKTFLPLLRRAQGRIIMIGSQSGYVASPFLGPYTASKYALEGLVDSLRQELRPWRLEVSLIEPGTIETPIWRKGREQLEQLTKQASKTAHDLYQPLFTAMEHFVEHSAARGISPRAVACIVDKALSARRPKTRYRVGIDAKASWWLGRLLPDRWMDALLAKIFGLPSRL